MAKTAGRDQVGPMERLLRIVICLADAGADGVPVRKLLRVAGYDDLTDANAAQLRRDLKHLSTGGWHIVNESGDGTEGRYVLHAHDNRMALLLTPGERAALQQALLEADADIPAPPECLGDLQRATVRHCLTHFTYKGHLRHVHPYSLYSSPSGWALRGRETRTQVIKEFVVSRMADDVEIDQPGTAEIPPTAPQRAFDPMDWAIDEPVTVVLATEHGHLTEVHRVLAQAQIVGEDGDRVLLSRCVTNRAAFWSRVYELGIRVEILAPPTLRAEVIENLRLIANGAG
jgi:predicted DNA-binding transcriptional regulator YafY